MARSLRVTAVALHAVLGILDRLVEAALVLLARSVGRHLVLHRHSDVALRPHLHGRQEQEVKRVV